MEAQTFIYLFIKTAAIKSLPSMIQPNYLFKVNSLTWVRPSERWDSQFCLKQVQMTSSSRIVFTFNGFSDIVMDISFALQHLPSERICSQHQRLRSERTKSITQSRFPYKTKQKHSRSSLCVPKLRNTVNAQQPFPSSYSKYPQSVSYLGQKDSTTFQ